MSTPASKQSERTRHSPCVGVCQLDTASGWCLGCGRTGNEIGRWLSMSEDERLRLWDALPGRLDQLAVKVHLLAWTAAEIGSWVRTTLQSGHGTWVTGVPGASAEFPSGPPRAIDVTLTDSQIEARADDAHFRLRLHDKLRAFAFGEDGPIVLGLPKVRSTLPVAKAFTALGADKDAVDTARNAHELFDFGIGRESARFALRTAQPELIATLWALEGQPWTSVLQSAGAQIVAESPHRVVETALARIEVFSPISPPGTMSQAGAQTHFVPAHLLAEEEAPAGLALPVYAQQVAVYHPAKS